MCVAHLSQHENINTTITIYLNYRKHIGAIYEKSRVFALVKYRISSHRQSDRARDRAQVVVQFDAKQVKCPRGGSRQAQDPVGHINNR